MGFFSKWKKKKNAAEENAQQAVKKVAPAEKPYETDDDEIQVAVEVQADDKQVLEAAKNNKAVSKCVIGDFMHYRNVVSKTYKIPKDKIQEAMSDFLKGIFEAKLKPEQLPFFIMGEDKDGMLGIKFWIPILQVAPTLPAGYHFDSYFSIDDMACVCISEKPEVNTKDAYIILSNFMVENHCEPITPIFNVIGGDSKNQYTFIKVGFVKTA